VEDDLARAKASWTRRLLQLAQAFDVQIGEERHAGKGTSGRVALLQPSALASRVQNVNVSQTLFQRMLGIGDVDWDTAGTEEASSEFRFRGVDDPSRLSRIVDEKLHEAETRA